MQRRRFFAAICVLLPWCKSLFSLEAQSTTQQAASTAAAGSSGFLGVLNLILPLTNKIVDGIFAKNRNENQFRAAIQHLADDLGVAVQPVNEDVKQLTAWRKITSAFDGPQAIKDSLIEIGVLSDAAAAERFTDAGLVAVKGDIIRRVEETTARLRDVVKEASLDRLPQADRADARDNVSKIGATLKRIADVLRPIKDVTDAGRIRQTLSTLGTVALQGIENCESLTFRNEDYQIRLSDDFFQYIELFKGKVDEATKNDSKSRTSKTLGERERVPLERASTILDEVVGSLQRRN